MAKFSDVFEAFLEGGVVRRKVWPRRDTLSLAMVGFYLYADDFKSDDWEVVDDGTKASGGEDHSGTGDKVAGAQL